MSFAVYRVVDLTRPFVSEWVKHLTYKTCPSDRACFTCTRSIFRPVVSVSARSKRWSSPNGKRIRKPWATRSVATFSSARSPFCFSVATSLLER